MSIANLRIAINDQERTKSDESIGIGDGVRKIWNLEMRPIKTGTAVITVAGVEQTIATDYTLDLDTGLLTFEDTSIPPEDDEIMALTYTFYTFSDATLTTILAQAGDNVLRAGAWCLRTLASSAALFFVWTSADEEVDKSKVCLNLLRTADAMEKRATAADQESKAVPASGAEHWEVTEEDFGEDTRIDLTEYNE